MKSYFHNVPGRLRVKIPILKGNPTRIGAVEDLLLSLPGMQGVRTNALTCSVVVNYDPDLVDPHRILRLLADHHNFDVSNAVTQDELVRTAAAKAGTKISKMILGWVVSKTLEAGGFSLLAAII